MAVRDLFEGLEARVIKWLVGLILLGIVFLVLHELYKNGTLSFLPTDSSQGFLLFLTANLLDDIGGTFLVAGILGVFFEVVLRKGMIEDVSSVVEKLKKPPALRDFRVARNELDAKMSADIRSLHPGERIDLLGVSQRVVFADQPGIDVIREKVVAGCEFRILVLHPASALVACIQNLSKNYGFPDLKSSLRDTYTGRVKSLVDRLANENPRRGRLEIRMYRDLISTVSYHRSPRLKILGLYFSHESGTQCPVLELESGHLCDQAQKNFETLWEASASNVLVLVEANRCEEHITDSFA